MKKFVLSLTIAVIAVLSITEKAHARIYSPQAGRFISRDPILTRGGINIYTYAGNRPQSRIDSFGLADTKPGKPNQQSPNTTPDPRYIRYNEGESFQSATLDVTTSKGTTCAKAKYNGSVDDNGFEITFSVEKCKLSKEEQKECECLCPGNNWAFIQHVYSQSWHYDNGTHISGLTNIGWGSPSIPSNNQQINGHTANIQPTNNPQINPWYGGGGNILDQELEKLEKEKGSELTNEEIDNYFKNVWARNPKPQTTISDKATGELNFFVTQLVCLKTGEVYAHVEWAIRRDKNGYHGEIFPHDMPDMTVSSTPDD